MYGGETCTYIRCVKCCNVKERKEGFLNLTLEIQNLTTLEESFNRYIEGERISDFNCESCKQKVDIVKRSCVEKIPNVLIVRLQRIVFDLDTL